MLTQNSIAVVSGQWSVNQGMKDEGGKMNRKKWLRPVSSLIPHPSSLITLALLLWAGVLPVLAQKMPSYVIRNARLVTVSGPEIAVGTIVISDGKITGIGPAAKAPTGAQEIDGKGLIVYPGMIEAGTSLGLIEVGSGMPGTVDTNELGDYNPQEQAYLAVNPHSAHINVTRANGITSALTFPRGGIIAGQAAVINLDGLTPREMALVQDAGLYVNFPRVATSSFDFTTFTPQTIDLTTALAARDKQLDGLRKVLRAAQDYGTAQTAYAQDKSLPRPERNVMYDALQPYLLGKKPFMFAADRAIDIKAAVKFAAEMKLQAVIVGGAEAWQAADVLKANNVPVIVTSVLDLPRTDDDNFDVNYEMPAKLQQAGVRFCISTGDSGAESRNLPYNAGMAAAFGLPKDEAIKSVTLYPAQILGLGDKLGSLETGKIANVVVTDGDLLEARTRARYLFINGRMVPLTSRHTELYEQFKGRK